MQRLLHRPGSQTDDKRLVAAGSREGWQAREGKRPYVREARQIEATVGNSPGYGFVAPPLHTLTLDPLTLPKLASTHCANGASIPLSLSSPPTDKRGLCERPFSTSLLNGFVSAPRFTSADQFSTLSYLVLTLKNVYFLFFYLFSVSKLFSGFNLIHFPYSVEYVSDGLYSVDLSPARIAQFGTTKKCQPEKKPLLRE